MKTVLFLILLNHADGTQQTLFSADLQEAACMSIMQQVKSAPANPVAYVTPDYDVPAVDVACIALDDLSATISRESE